MNDRKLMIKIKNGDQKALNQLLDRLYPSLYRFVTALMHDSEDAKDITQETLIKFIKHLDTYEERCRIETYVCSIALNLTRDHYRKMKQHPLLELDKEIEDQRIGPHQQTMDLWQRDHMLKAINQLPKEQKEVILLRYYYQFKIREIAELYQIKENTVKTRLRLGLKKLKERWEESK